LLNDGLVVDREFVLINYPKLEQVAGSENRDELRGLVNNTYLERLQQRIETGALSIPKSLIALLEHNNMDALVATHQGAVKQKMLEFLQNFPRDSLKTKEPIELLSQVQTAMIECICKELQVSEAFKSDFAACLKLEQHWTAMRADAKEFVHSMLMPTVEETINGKQLSDKEKNFYLQKIREELPRCIPDKIQKDLEFVLKSSDQETTLQARVDAKIASLTASRLQKYLMQKAVSILDSAQAELRAANDWKTTYTCEHVIKFSQGADDNNQILGDGCCFAINLKWGKALAEHGTKKIYSLEQLTRTQSNTGDPAKCEQVKGMFNTALIDKYRQKTTVASSTPNDENSFDDPIPKMRVVEEDEGDGVTRRDRFIQARYLVENKLSRKADFIQTQEHLKQDGYKVVESQVNPQISVVENVKALNMAAEGKFDPKGFIDIGIYEEGSLAGHAIGCKIDHSTSYFLFWDPNYGIFKTKTFDDFCKSFDAFLQENYPSWKPYQLRDIHK